MPVVTRSKSRLLSAACTTESQYVPKLSTTNIQPCRTTKESAIHKRLPKSKDQPRASDKNLKFNETESVLEATDQPLLQRRY